MKAAKRIYVGLVFVFLYAPIIILMLYSFNDSRSRGKWGGFTLKWYGELFSDAETMAALETTLLIALLSAVIATVVGTITAFGMYYMKKKPRAILSGISYLPVMNPDIVTGISMLLFFVFAGNLLGTGGRSFFTILIAHVTFCLPYVILSVTPKLRQMNKFLTEAALDLGCTPIVAFFRVELPSILPGVFSGMVMAFTLSLDDFVISNFTSGQGFQTLPVYIYNMIKKRVTPDVYALYTLIFLAILALLLLSNFIQARSEEKNDPHSKRNRHSVAR